MTNGLRASSQCLQHNMCTKLDSEESTYMKYVDNQIVKNGRGLWSNLSALKLEDNATPVTDTQHTRTDRQTDKQTF